MLSKYRPWQGARARGMQSAPLLSTAHQERRSTVQHTRSASMSAGRCHHTQASGGRAGGQTGERQPHAGRAGWRWQVCSTTKTLSPCISSPNATNAWQYLSLGCGCTSSWHSSTWRWRACLSCHLSASVIQLQPMPVYCFSLGPLLGLLPQLPCLRGRHCSRRPPPPTACSCCCRAAALPMALYPFS